MNLKGKRICDNCFTEIKLEPCKVCSYKKSLYHPEPGILPVGTVLKHRYHIGQVLGRGGFGITYKAYDSQNDVIVAIKEYYPNGIAHRDTGTTQMSVTDSSQTDAFKNGAGKFFEEAKTVSRFNGNPNIVNVYEFFYENSTVYYVMEYLEGCDLKYYIKNNGGKISQGKVMTVLNVVTDALVITHSLNVLHRDISPDNIFIQGDGEVKLIDFGAARQVMAEQSKSLSVILKQGFAPLEQYQRKGKQGPWTDIYALGATCLYALTGVIPDDATERIEEPELGNASDYGIDEGFWKIIEKCLAIRTADRYQNVLELKQELAGLGIVPEPLIKEEADIPLTVAVPFGDVEMSEQALVHTYVPQEVLNNISQNGAGVGATVLHTENADMADEQKVTVQNTDTQSGQDVNGSDMANEDAANDEEEEEGFFKKNKLIIMIAIFLIIVIIIIAVVFVVINSRNNGGTINQSEINDYTQSEKDTLDSEETGESSGEDATETDDGTDKETGDSETDSSEQSKPTQTDDTQPSESEGIKETEDITTKPSETTAKPTQTTSKPTETSTQKPTEAPTQKPTQKPTEAPTQKPTEPATQKPTEAPTQKPTEPATQKPTEAPTQKPTEPATQKPTEPPTTEPATTEAPTEPPTTSKSYVNNRWCSIFMGLNQRTSSESTSVGELCEGRYTGEWQNDKPNGKGYFIYNKGVDSIERTPITFFVVEGEWKDGYLHGKGTRMRVETINPAFIPHIYRRNWSDYLCLSLDSSYGKRFVEIVVGNWNMGVPANTMYVYYASSDGDNYRGECVGTNQSKEMEWDMNFEFDSGKIN